uniref:Uncharacterized protein n=1 Tax=Cucumis sativus TaxID=3659 RepID=A0A0A0KFK5_CUCSA
MLRDVQIIHDLKLYIMFNSPLFSTPIKSMVAQICSNLRQAKCGGLPIVQCLNIREKSEATVIEAYLRREMRVFVRPQLIDLLGGLIIRVHSEELGERFMELRNGVFGLESALSGERGSA